MENSTILQKNMASRIIFLGTGGSQAVTGKQYRATGGIVIQTGEHQFHLDPGPGALTRSAEYSINPRETTAVFCTHAHLTHCNDVNVLLEAMTHAGEDKRGLLVANRTLLEGSNSFDPYVTNYHKRCVERVILFEKGQKLGIDNLEIHATPTAHKDTNAIGLKFFTPDFVLTYSGDTKFNKESTKFYKNSDILVLNVVNPGGVEEGDNLNVNSAIKIVNTVAPKLLVITHFGIKALKADPLIMARQIQRVTQVQTLAAKDGMVINPQSYSAGIKQKTLNLYKL